MFDQNNDWTHAQDYDNPDADWLDYTMVGASFQHEIDRLSDDHRHRWNSFGSVWKKGPPREN